jgi:hypothetical protein
MKNFRKNLKDFSMPSTLKEYEELMRKQYGSSSTSEAKKEGQQEATKVYEVRFVNNQKKNI